MVTVFVPSTPTAFSGYVVVVPRHRLWSCLYGRGGDAIAGDRRRISPALAKKLPQGARACGGHRHPGTTLERRPRTPGTILKINKRGRHNVRFRLLVSATMRLAGRNERRSE